MIWTLRIKLLSGRWAEKDWAATIACDASSTLEEERASTLLLRCDENERSARIELAKIRTLKHGLMDDFLTGRDRVPVAEDAG
jgi:hypothetical protein